MSEFSGEARLAMPEEARPLAVARTEAFLDGRGVWFVLSRNRAARSCRDAARKRYRLGQTGIHLWDEMKSFFGAVRTANGPVRHVVVHCRGDRKLDLDNVARVVRSTEPPERLEPKALQHLGMAYGLVNPFEPWALDGQLLGSHVLQVFDEDLLAPLGVPGTVMTNAGDLTWGVELLPAELVGRLDHAVVATVSNPGPGPPRPQWITSPTTIGILTGNAPESGIALWERLNNRIREMLGDDCKGDVSMPRVIVRSLPELGMSMELDSREDEVWKALRVGVAEMCRDGVRILALACNTTPYFTPGIRDICGEYGTDFVSMPETVGAWLREHEIAEAALVGIRCVSDLGAWSAYREPMRGIAVERPGARAMKRLDELAYEVKATGVDDTGLNRLRDILRQEVRSESVVLALTELSVLLDLQRRPGRSGKTLIDPLSLYADAIAARYVGQSYPLTLHSAKNSKRFAGPPES